MYAAKGSLENLILLLNYKSDQQKLKDIINTKDYDNKSVLYYSIVNENYNIAKYLLDNGADVNSSDINGIDSLMVASKIGNYNLVKLLIDRGANVSALGPNNVNAIKIAKEMLNISKKSGDNYYKYVNIIHILEKVLPF